jgi:lipopolysaccharide biosynthesis glycosyltransferase
MDLAAMRAAGSVDRFVELFQSSGMGLAWGDQDALNILYRNAWTQLHPRWNAQNSLWTWRPWAVDLFGEQVVDEAVQSPAVVHFEGPWLSKPWHYLCTHPYVGTYRDALAQTPWRKTPLEDRTATTRLIRLLPKRRRLGAYIRLRRLRMRRRGTVD